MALDSKGNPLPPPTEMPMYEKTIAEIAATGSIGVSALPMEPPGGLAGGMKSAEVMDHRPTVSEQLAMRKKHLEHELAQVNAAIEHALQNQPTMKLLDSISKVGLLR